MSIRLKNIIAELRVKIIYEDCLEKDGHYIAALNLIIINNDLSELRKTEVLLHELGHAAMHQDNYQLYKLTYSLHSKMENDADNYMIDGLIADSDGYYNYSQVVESYKVGIGYDTQYEKIVL